MLKKTGWALMLSSLVGCQAISYKAAEPTADTLSIKEAQEIFSQAKYKDYIKVSNTGVIRYYERVPPGYKWERASLNEVAYSISCKSLRGFLKDGFTIIIDFQGRGGTYKNYDFQRCLNEDKSYSKS